MVAVLEEVMARVLVGVVIERSLLNHILPLLKVGVLSLLVLQLPAHLFRAKNVFSVVGMAFGLKVQSAYDMSSLQCRRAYSCSLFFSDVSKVWGRGQMQS